MNSPELRHAIADLINPARRNFLKTAAAGAATAGLFRYGLEARDAQAFAYEPYPTDDQLTTVVTSCDHNCGSRLGFSCNCVLCCHCEQRNRWQQLMMTSHQSS